MTQQNNPTNWVIQGANGQPQMIKFVQSGGKTVGGVVTPGLAQQVKFFKTTSGQDSSQAFTTSTPSTPIVRAIGTTQKFTTKTGSILSGISKGTKTFRFTPTQLQNLKIISTPKMQVNSTVIHADAADQQSIKNISPPILARKRANISGVEYTPDLKRIRKSEKVGKGLRHFSMKVCEKVRTKGTTTYNEVADELVGEFTNSTSDNALAEQYDQKNIRRRVYDALNVLMAMNIISKEKKEIKWIGLPTNSLQECIQLEKEKMKRVNSVREKKKQLQELIMNQISFKNLAQRNKEMEELHGSPNHNSYISLPFIVISTNKKTEIDCSISNDKMEYKFHFNDKFEINDDLEVLKSIGMLMGLDTGDCTPENLEKMKGMVPKSLEDYVTQLAFGTPDGLEQIVESGSPSTSTMLYSEDLVETTLDEVNSRNSSNDPLSPSGGDSSDVDGDSDTSSDELNKTDLY